MGISNTLAVNATSVINQGFHDCDGNGTFDPNILTGTTVARGGVICMTVSDALRGRLQ